jgi:hypothetical protein
VILSLISDKKGTYPDANDQEARGFAPDHHGAPAKPCLDKTNILKQLCYRH